MNCHRNIYNQYISGMPIGYCHCNSHKGALTTQLLKKHKCTKKVCPYLQKNLQHPYWMLKKEKKEKSKERKRLFLERLSILQESA